MVKDGKYVPNRGDMIWLDFLPQRGHEQAGRRPALVISPKKYNEKVGLLIACPITTAIKNYPFEVKVPDELDISGVILTDQVKSLDWRARNAKFICELPDQVIDEVLAKLATLVK
ncbi:MAG: endoribonuclease MazF [Candidatus Hodarchaeota archaeon]